MNDVKTRDATRSQAPAWECHAREALPRCTPVGLRIDRIRNTGGGSLHSSVFPGRSLGTRDWLALLAVVLLASGCGSTAAGGPTDHALDDQSAAVKAVGGKLEIHLNFAHTDITDDDLATLPLPATTTNINLSFTKITDDGLKHLQRMPQLEEVRIAHTQVTDAGVEHLMELENLWLIDANQSMISRKGQLKLIKFLAPRAQAHQGRSRNKPAS